MGIRWDTWSRAIVIVPLAAILLSACGPMNGERKAGPATGTSGSSLNSVNISKNRAFFVYSTLQSSTGPSASDAPQVGNNVFLLRCVHATDLRSPSEQATLRVTYWMPDHPAMGTSDAVASRQTDGTYRVTLFFSMPGRWQMTVGLTDGSTQDEYVFEATL